jgi:hypothetical protein
MSYGSPLIVCSIGFYSTASGVYGRISGGSFLSFSLINFYRGSKSKMLSSTTCFSGLAKISVLVINSVSSA